VTNKTINDIKQEYYNHYQYLVPNINKIDKVRELWSEYNKAGISSPDIDAINANFPKIDEAFFQEVVKIASKFSGKNMQIEYCAFILNDYNLCARSAADGYLIIIDEFYLGMLYILANIFKFEANNYIEEDEFNHYVRLVQDVVIDYLKHIEKKDAITQLQKRDYETAEFAVYLYNAFKIFMFAHEISHHLLGHTKETISKQFSMNERNCQIEIDRVDCADEFEADTYGYKIFLEVMNTVDDSINYAYCKYRYEYAPLFLFDIFDKIDRLKEEKMGMKIKYTTHPPPMDRKANLLKQYQFNNPGILYYSDSHNEYNIMKDVLNNMIKKG
jgi:uncharacterized protein (UPF0305 family)